MAKPQQHRCQSCTLRAQRIFWIEVFRFLLVFSLIFFRSLSNFFRILSKKNKQGSKNSYQRVQRNLWEKENFFDCLRTLSLKFLGNLVDIFHMVVETAIKVSKGTFRRKKFRREKNGFLANTFRSFWQQIFTNCNWSNYLSIFDAGKEKILEFFSVVFGPRTEIYGRLEKIFAGLSALHTT